MTVQQNSGSANDHSIGLIAMSKHQGLWRHTPNVPYSTAPDANFQTWLANNLGIGATRWQRTPMTEQFTGHTAVMTRVAGIATFARGFVPRIVGYPGAFLGNGGVGTWQDDIGMISDPTCISFEVPLRQANHATGFPAWFQANQDQINIYSLTGGNANNSFNCVLAAVTSMINYLLDLGGYEGYVEQLCTINSSGQGPLMRKMMSGFS